jgi:hypothetical protein
MDKLVSSVGVDLPPYAWLDVQLNLEITPMWFARVNLVACVGYQEVTWAELFVNSALWHDAVLFLVVSDSDSARDLGPLNELFFRFKDDMEDNWTLFVVLFPIPHIDVCFLSLSSCLLFLHLFVV